MRSISKYCMAIVIVALAAMWRGWNDTWYLATGMLTVAIPLAILIAWRLIRPARRAEPQSIDGVSAERLTGGEADFDRDSPFVADALAADSPDAAREDLIVGAFKGVLLGVALTGYLMVTFSILQQFPWIYDRYYDSDRPMLEANLSTLEQAGNFGEAVRKIEERIAQKTGLIWRESLLKRLYGDLLQRAQGLTPAECLPVLNRALEISAEGQFGDAAARTLHEQATREIKLTTRIDELSRQQDWTAVIDVLKSELLRDEESAHTAQMLYDALCTAAADAKNTKRQSQYYSEGIQLAGRYGLPADRAQAALAQIESAIGEQSRHKRRIGDLEQSSAESHRELIDELSNVANQLPGPESRLKALRRVAALSERHNIDVPTVVQHVAELEEALTTQRKFTKRVDLFRSHQDYDDAVALLASAVREKNDGNWIREYDADLIACLEEWCDVVAADNSDLTTLRVRLKQAVNIAVDCGLEAPLLKHRLSVADASWQRQQQQREQRLRSMPIELPKGSKAGIGRIWTDTLPFVVVDIWVEHADGTPITGLQSKDFAVKIDGQKVPLQMRPVKGHAIPRRFAILVDISGSTSSALQIVKAGICEFVTQLSKTNSEMKLIPFNSTVNNELPWTREAAAITSAVTSLKSDGGTALYQALFAAGNELDRQPRDAEKHIVVWTDGANSVPGVSLDKVLDTCRAEKLPIWAIALRTNELDFEVLERVTTETNGQYFEAVNVHQLGPQFSQAVRAIEGKVYRIVLDIEGQSRNAISEGNCLISIGRGSPVVVHSRL